MTADQLDIELLDGLKNGKPAMFEHLFERYWEDLYRIAYKRLRDQQEAEDIVQDIFTTIWQRRDSLTITTSFRAYLHTALKNSIIRRVAKADLQEKTISYLLTQMQQIESSVIDVMAAGEIHHTLNTAIQGFPENMRKIFLLRAEALTVSEIAKALSLSPQTVKNNSTEAIRRLKVILMRKHPDIPSSFYLILILFIKV